MYHVVKAADTGEEVGATTGQIGCSKEEATEATAIHPRRGGPTTKEERQSSRRESCYFFGMEGAFDRGGF